MLRVKETKFAVCFHNTVDIVIMKWRRNRDQNTYKTLSSYIIKHLLISSYKWKPFFIYTEVQCYSVDETDPRFTKST
jgi:hypothetical protein